MTDSETTQDILTAAYKRMHRYTCAEASLQALLELWGLPISGNSWATAGYSGAIMSGKTTCGLLIGSTVAIGLYYGHDLDGRPEEEPEARGKAIEVVNDLYKAVLDKFGASDCRTLVKVDFQDPEQVATWMQNKGWKETCDVFLDFVIHHCLSAVSF